VLAGRLRNLVKAGVLCKQVYSERPKRHEYRLADNGLDLYPVMMAIVHWGDTHMAGNKGRPLLQEHIACGHIFDPLILPVRAAARRSPRALCACGPVLAQERLSN